MGRSLFAILFALALALPRPAAAMVVFDPTNFTQNVITATQAVSAELQRVQQSLLQTQQYVTQLRNLEKMVDPVAIIRDYSPEMAAGIQYVQTLRTLYGDLRNLHDSVDQQFQEQAMSGLSWDQYVHREISLAQRKLSTAQTAFAAVRGAMERIDSDYAQMREAQKKIYTTDGAQGQSTLMNQQLNQLVSITREMLTSMSALVQASGESSLSEAAIKDNANKNDPVTRQGAEAEWKRQQDAVERVRNRAGPVYH